MASPTSVMAAISQEHNGTDSSPSTWKHPPSFYCPISQQCMHDPVVLSDGHSYERRHIERWLERHSTSPVSGLQLQQTDIFPNHALRNAIEEYFQQIFSVHRRAIRKSINGSPECLESESLGSNVNLLRTIDALMQCSLLVHADLSIECVLRQIMDEAKALVGAEVASVFLVDAVRQDLYSKVNSTGGEIRIPIAAGIAGHVATTGEPSIIHDAYSDGRFDNSVDMKTGFKTRNIMCVPLKVKKDHIIGVVQLINKCGANLVVAEGSHLDRFGGSADCKTGAGAGAASPEQRRSCPSAFTLDDLQFLQVFASQAATALANNCVFEEQPPSRSSSEAGDQIGTPSGAPRLPSKTLILPKEMLPSSPSPPPPAAVAAAAEAQGAKQQQQQQEDVAAARDPPEAEATASAEAQRIAGSMATADVESVAKVREMLDHSFDKWALDTLSLAELTGNKPLSTLGVYLFDRLGLVERFNLDRSKLCLFLTEIENGYDDVNRYHNRAHAASVMHATHLLLQSGGLATYVAAVFKTGGAEADKDGCLESMACLLAAAIHDYEHRGLNNDFLVRTIDERALRYNNLHVNEQHHVSAAFALAMRDEYNFLTSLAPSEFRHLHSLIIDMVIATDMADNTAILKAFSAATAKGTTAQEGSYSEDGCSDSPKVSPAYIPKTISDAILLLQMAMKCADLGHLTLSWDMHMKWVRRLEQEFFSQGDKERSLDMTPISFLMDREKPGVTQKQVGFFDFVALPLFRALANAVPAAKPLLDGVKENYRRWQEIEANLAQQ